MVDWDRNGLTREPFPPPQETSPSSSRRRRRRSAPPPMAFGLWRCGGSRPPAGGRDPVLVFARLNVLVGAVWRRRCPSVAIMSPASYLRPDGANSIVGGCVEVCLRRISWDSVGVGLRWISMDPVLVHLRSCVYRLNFSDLHFCSSVKVAVLMRWSYGA